MKVRRVRVLTSKASGKKYYRFDLTLPHEVVEELGWAPGTELKGEIKGTKFVLEKSDES